MCVCVIMCVCARLCAIVRACITYQKAKASHTVWGIPLVRIFNSFSPLHQHHHSPVANPDASEGDEVTCRPGDIATDPYLVVHHLF